MTFKETKFVRQETFEKAFPLEEESLLKNGDRKKGDSNDATKKQMVPFSKLVSRLERWDLLKTDKN